jgi:two-component system, NtrC family, sensor kinase
MCVRSRARGYRSMLFAPLISNGAPIGTISVTRREAGSFAAHHVRLLQTFADQAVIAIENVRLFDEVQARTRDLTESLQQQTATADVLKVISRSTFDLEPALVTVCETAARLCDADQAAIYRREGDLYRFAACFGFPPDYEKAWRAAGPGPNNPQSPLPGHRAVAERRPVQVLDVTADPAYFSTTSGQSQARTALGVPLLREGEPVGNFVIARRRVQSFTDRQLELVQTFADQAVIAIENARLFDEVQAKTRDLGEALQQPTATADVLKVISRSAFDLQMVLQTLVESAAKLCSATMANIWLRDGDALRTKAHTGMSDRFSEFLRTRPIAPDRGTFVGRAFVTGKPVHLPDVLADPEYTFVESPKVGGFRSALGVPLIRDGRVEGVFALARPEPGAFSAREIALVSTFADQAAIAIENVRLFDEVQARTRELAASLDELRAAQDRLVQTEKLASLGQLTAGIAHEIKNPLNFVNNFAALSAELTDELNDLLKSAALTDKIRDEADELTGLLKDNLGKVVQHGKRADSIVKNMLLHSREGSGEHRPADVNALVEESLNLAYHGARAEKPEFNVTMKRDLDPNAGIIEVFPQEVTRVLLNLISNGFYAVTKRKADNGEGGFEPVVTATTKGAIDHVEIRIRDNGTGIPPDVKEKMFNPFFTTKPAGEGTGLGLSMSHDIVVKQHGGTIDVDTAPGEFTEFTIVLPRTSNLSNKARG